jgi:hypothetical protein
MNKQTTHPEGRDSLLYLIPKVIELVTALSVFHR